MTRQAGAESVDSDGSEDPRAYIRIAASVRQRIADGALMAGYPVPSIRTLCQEMGHSRQTAGKALRMLEGEGVVARVAGLGYFVTGPAPAGSGDGLA